jgi:ribosomal protein S18 acetylase RimI-like enzyme
MDGLPQSRNRNQWHSRQAVRITLHPARIQDFDYCASLYFSGMKAIIQELNLDMAAQAAGFREQWKLTQVRIIRLDGVDVGWLQSDTIGDTVFLAQLFVNGPFQRQGIGTQVMNCLIGEATLARQAVTLAVVKINPALRLYERLGFRITHEDDRKFYMRREPDADVSILKT